SAPRVRTPIRSRIAEDTYEVQLRLSSPADPIASTSRGCLPLAGTPSLMSAWLPLPSLLDASSPPASRRSSPLPHCLAAFAASAHPPPRVYPQPPDLAPARHHLCAAGKSDKVG